MTTDTQSPSSTRTQTLMTTATVPRSPATDPAALAALLQAVGEGRALEAFARFYADDVRMQENEEPPTVGFAANLARERAFVASVAEWQEFTVLASAAGGEHTFYECVMRWIGTDGKPYRVRQVAIARWRDGRIVEERFVHAP